MNKGVRRLVCLAVSGVVASAAWCAPAEASSASTASTYEVGLLISAVPHTVSSHFAVPPIVCGRSPAAFDVGLGNAPTAAAPTLFAGVRVVCVGGNLAQQLITVIGSTTTAGAFIPPGDPIQVSLSQDKTLATTHIVDAANDVSLDASGMPAFARSLLIGGFSVFLDGVQQPPLPVRVRFTHCVFTGKALATLTPQRVTLPVPSRGYTLKPSAPTPTSTFVITNDAP